MTAAELAQRLNARRSGQGWSSKCPAHPDRTPSLSIREGADGRVLLKCFAGCSPEGIVAALGIRMSDLFPEASKREEGSATAPQAKETEASKPLVTPRLAELLDEIVKTLRRYVVFPLPEQPVVISLWVLHTWSFEAFDYTPYLSVWAASKRAGKSRVLDVLELLVKNPIKTESGSSAALIRSINEKNPPTFLLDEVDKLYTGKKSSEGEADSTCRFFNARYRRGAKFLRCVGQGAAIEAKEFPAFCRKATAGIGRCLPDTVADRSIPIELVRQTREERAERLGDREARAALAPLKPELEAWAKQPEVIDALRDARPVMPDELHDRAQDITEPLLAIADLAGNEWPGRARSAVVKLYAGEEDADIGVRLLADIKKVFDEKKAEKLFTETIIKELVANADDAPWALWFEDALKHDKLDSAASRLAKKLKEYHIKPSRFRIGEENKKGYQRAQFEKAWKQLLTAASPPPFRERGTRGTRGTERDLTRGNPCSPFNDTTVNVHPLCEKGGTQNHEAKMPNVHPVHAVHPNLKGGQKEVETLPKTKPGWHGCLTETDGRLRLCDECEAEFNAGKTVYPCDRPEWVKLTPNETEAHWQAAWRQAVSKTCEVCEESLTDEPYVWSHLADGVAQCANCREIQWWSDGYEVDGFGCPSCWHHARTREQRIAERKCAMLERATPEWKRSDEGKTLLEKARRECVRLRVYGG